MSEPSFSFKRILNHASKQGFIAGLILIGVTVVVYVFSINMYSPLMGLVSLAVTWGTIIIFLYKAAAGYRTELDVSIMDYWPTMLLLFITALITFYMSAFFGYLLNTVIDPEYHLELIRQFEEDILPQMPEEMRAETLARTKSTMQPMKQLLSSLLGSTLMALIFSVIMAFLVRKNPKHKEKF